MEGCFIDSSGFFALADRDCPVGDAIQDFLRQGNHVFVTTNLVIAETVSLITKRIAKNAAIRLGDGILASHLIECRYVDDGLQDAAWQMFRKYKDKDFDLIDAVSFVVCHQQGIKQALTLDHHFSQMGFKILP